MRCESSGCQGCWSCVGIVRERTGMSWNKCNSEGWCFGGVGAATRVSETYKDAIKESMMKEGKTMTWAWSKS